MALESVIKDEFNGEVSVQFLEDPGVTGNFEVILLETGKLIHSKSTDGKGKCESNKERGLLIEQIQEYLEAQ